MDLDCAGLKIEIYLSTFLISFCLLKTFNNKLTIQFLKPIFSVITEKLNSYFPVADLAQNDV